jgi:hypothetical protein
LNLRLCDDGGKNNGVWLKRTEGVRKIFIFPHTYLLSWGTNPYARQTEGLVFGCNKHNLNFYFQNSSKHLESLSHFETHCNP